MILPRRLLVLAVSALLTAPSFAATYAINNITDQHSGTCGGNCSLRDAIIAANGNNNDAGETDIINLASGTYTLTITGKSENSSRTGDLDITQSLTIAGATNNPSDTIIDASTLGDRIFHITGISGANVTLRNLTLQNATLDAENGGAIYNSSTTSLTLNNVFIQDNQTTNIGAITNAALGGGIYNDGTLTIENNSQIIGNTANVDQLEQLAVYGGGGLYNTVKGNVTINDNSSFTKNRAQNSYVPNNPSADFRNYASGGAILNLGTMLIENSHIGSDSPVDGNISDSGGGISNLGGFLTISRSTISYNSTTSGDNIDSLDGRTGGGIFSQNAGENRGSVLITASTINNNYSDKNGGGVYNSGSPLTITHSTLNNNTAFYIGGAITNAGNQSAEISNSTIAYNTTTAPTTTQGGGIYLSSRINLTSVTLVGNDAAEGAQLYIKDSSLLDPRTIKPQATLTLSLIAHHNATLGNEAPLNEINCGGATQYIVSGNYNVETGGSCALQAGSDIANGAPELDTTLADNGTSPVPPTKTIALLGGDGIDIRPISGCPARDQRYYKRTASTCDAGAYELGGTPADPESSDLKITIGESQDPAVTDIQLTYTMTVTNVGPDDADAPVYVYFYFPTNLAIDSTYSYNIVDGKGGACNAGVANDLVCNLGAIAKFATRQFSVTITPKEASDPQSNDPLKQALIVNAEVTGPPGADYFSANNTFTETTEIQDKRNCDAGVPGCPAFPSSGGGGGSLPAGLLYILASWLTVAALRRRWQV